MDIEVFRFGHSPMGTFGEMIVGGQMRCMSVEREWANNQPGKSCVPCGIYQLEPHESKKYGKVWALTNKEMGITHWKEHNSLRYGILLHAANYARQLQGCIAPGKTLSAHTGNWMVTSSRDTLTQILGMLDENEEHRVIIRLHENTRAMAERRVGR